MGEISGSSDLIIILVLQLFFSPLSVSVLAVRQERDMRPVCCRHLTVVE